MKVSWTLLLFCIATGEHLSLIHPSSLANHASPRPGRPRRQLELKSKSSSSSSRSLSAYHRELVYQIPTAQDSVHLQQATTT